MPDIDCIYISSKHHRAAYHVVADINDKRKAKNPDADKFTLRDLVEQSLEANPDFKKWYK